MIVRSTARRSLLCARRSTGKHACLETTQACEDPKNKQTHGFLTCTRHQNDWEESYCLGCRSVWREQGWGAGPLSALILGKWGDRARVSPGFCCDPRLLLSPTGLASKDQTHGNGCNVHLHSARFYLGNLWDETQKRATTDL